MFFLQAPSPYSFAYAVKDEPSYNDFGHSETSDGKAVTGSYSVVLPDGRKQIVNYKVDAYSGYVAEVKYEGIAYHPVAASYSPSKAVPVALYVKEVMPTAEPAPVEAAVASPAVQVYAAPEVAPAVPAYDAKVETKEAEPVKEESVPAKTDPAPAAPAKAYKRFALSSPAALAENLYFGQRISPKRQPTNAHYYNH